ncbi:LCP family protein [Sporosarcina ureilytica]|uniref:Transcriptional regulator n=1 Tax=Sporosarcina ureilytica TaxID=298596 RepID=A0A1D8JIL3_9BACL|nr:LCP family protein [Sporosarcina ureilytica]AOV08543.1 transcriptional regulator [Sporosarcina ureilytica]
MKRQEYKRISRKRSGKRLAIKISLLVALTAFLSVVGYGVFLQKKATNAANRAYEALDDRTKSELREEAVEPLKDNVSILFIGVDESDKRKDSGNPRSDALLVATLNNKEKTVKLLSIPRDSYVYVPSRGRQDKITHAHAFGGTKGTIDAVEGFLDIPIDYYVKMNFNAFIEVVDAVGGIDVEVPYDRIELDENDQRTIELKKGLQHLDGQHALALARTRKLDSDVERGKRQQMILQAIMKEAFSVKSITKYGDVIDAIGDNMKTDMTFNEMKSFIEYVKGGIPEVTMLNLAGTDDMSTGIYYWMLDEEQLDDVKYELKSHLGLSPFSTSLTDKSRGLETDSNEAADEADYKK